MVTFWLHFQIISIADIVPSSEAHSKNEKQAVREQSICGENYAYHEEHVHYQT